MPFVDVGARSVPSHPFWRVVTWFAASLSIVKCKWWLEGAWQSSCVLFYWLCKHVVGIAFTKLASKNVLHCSWMCLIWTFAFCLAVVVHDCYVLWHEGMHWPLVNVFHEFLAACTCTGFDLPECFYVICFFFGNLSCVLVAVVFFCFGCGNLPTVVFSAFPVHLDVIQFSYLI